MHPLTLPAAALAIAALTGCGVSTSSPAAAPIVPAATSTAATASESTTEPATPAAGADPIQVKVTSCAKGDFGATFKGTAKNTGTQILDATISVEVLDPKGDRVDEAGTIVTAIKPGQSVKIDGVGLAEISTLPAKISCRLLTVTSFPTA